MNWHNPKVLLGNGLLLVSAIYWALGACLYRRYKWQTFSWTQDFWQVFWSGIVIGIEIPAFGPRRSVIWTGAVVGVLLYNWIGTTAVCYLWWGKVLSVMRVSIVPQFLSLTSVTAVLISTALTHEPTHRDTRTMNDIAKVAAEIMGKVRAKRPLVHHLTNFVVMNETANITLCAGALPVMAHAKEEVAEMVAAAGALVLNIGTLWPEMIESMLIAGRRANELGIPIVLDPVGAGATRLRTESALRLLGELSIAVTRGNVAEIAVLAGREARISGVESLGVFNEAADVARDFARKHGCVAAVTGPVDIVTDGTRLARVANGHARMATVTGTGCMATAVVAAYAAVEGDYVTATASALAVYGLAGQIAAERAQGPGTFHVHLYDALAGLTEETLRSGARIEVSS